MGEEVRKRERNLCCSSSEKVGFGRCYRAQVTTGGCQARHQDGQKLCVVDGGCIAVVI